MASNPLLDLLARGELRSLLVGWFLWAPTAVLVPALGWVGAPIASRLALGLGMSLCVVPEVASAGGLWGELARALITGLSVAVGAAAVLWAALMAGGVADRFGPLGVHRAEAGAEALLAPSSPLTLLFGLTSALLFLAGGGPHQVGSALSRLARPPDGPILQLLIDGCVASITLAVSVASPVLLAVLLLEVMSALIERSAVPLVVDACIAPLKALAFLFVVAIALEPMLGALAAALS